MIKDKREVGPYIGQLSNKIRRRMEASACKNQFSGAQGKVLHFILAHKGADIFQKDIEEAYGLRPSTASELVKKMEENGLVTREAVSYDARLKRIVTTEKALQYEEEVLKSIEELENSLIKGISQKDLDVFIQVIDKMLNNIS